MILDKILCKILKIERDISGKRKNNYFCNKIRAVMAVYMKAIPTLRGDVADRFIKISEENLHRRASVDFSREAANSYAILNKKKSVRK